MFDDAEGFQFLCDEVAWRDLISRFRKLRSKVPGPPSTSNESPFPPSLQFSRNGRFLSYTSRNDLPYNESSELPGDATIVEDARTGRRIAKLPGVTRDVFLSPCGRTAVSEKRLDDRTGEQPWLIVWDLATSTPRFELSLPASTTNCQYSPDGQYFFAETRFKGSMFRWWNVTTGTKIGDYVGDASPIFVNQGREILLQDYNSTVLSRLDITSGSEIDDWDLLKIPRHGERISRREAGSDRFAAHTFISHRDASSSRTVRYMERIGDRLPSLLDASPRMQIAVLDLTSHQLNGIVPGEAAAISREGKFIATLGDDGLVRVWELPLSRPWARGYLYAVAFVFGVWFVRRVVARWRHRRVNAKAIQAV